MRAISKRENRRRFSLRFVDIALDYLSTIILC
jgi:hypothetical protein